MVSGIAGSCYWTWTSDILINSQALYLIDDFKTQRIVIFLSFSLLIAVESTPQCYQKASLRHFSLSPFQAAFCFPAAEYVTYDRWLKGFHTIITIHCSINAWLNLPIFILIKIWTSAWTRSAYRHKKLLVIYIRLVFPDVYYPESPRSSISTKKFVGITKRKSAILLCLYNSIAHLVYTVKQ